MNSYVRLIIVTGLCIGAAHAPASAQLTDASLKGFVVDSTGEGIPAAEVTARHTATGQIRTAASDRTGAFLLAGLPPGLYHVRAESAGFRPVEEEGLRLTVGHTTEITIQLAVIELQETVNVSANAMRVATATEGRLADNFGRDEIQELPLAQRDVFLLPKLSAGATAIPGAASSTKLSTISPDTPRPCGCRWSPGPSTRPALRRPRRTVGARRGSR
jgi:hypothetical protein